MQSMMINDEAGVEANVMLPMIPLVDFAQEKARVTPAADFIITKEITSNTSSKKDQTKESKIKTAEKALLTVEYLLSRPMENPMKEPYYPDEFRFINNTLDEGSCPNVFSEDFNTSITISSLERDLITTKLDSSSQYLKLHLKGEASSNAIRFRRSARSLGRSNASLVDGALSSSDRLSMSMGHLTALDASESSANNDNMGGSSRTRSHGYFGRKNNQSINNLTNKSSVIAEESSNNSDVERLPLSHNSKRRHGRLTSSDSNIGASESTTDLGTNKKNQSANNLSTGSSFAVESSTDNIASSDMAPKRLSQVSDFGSVKSFASMESDSIQESKNSEKENTESMMNDFDQNLLHDAESSDSEAQYSRQDPDQFTDSDENCDSLAQSKPEVQEREIAELNDTDMDSYQQLEQVGPGNLGTRTNPGSICTISTIESSTHEAHADQQSNHSEPSEPSESNTTHLSEVTDDSMKLNGSGISEWNSSFKNVKRTTESAKTNYNEASELNETSTNRDEPTESSMQSESVASELNVSFTSLDKSTEGSKPSESVDSSLNGSSQSLEKTKSESRTPRRGKKPPKRGSVNVPSLTEYFNTQKQNDHPENSGTQSPRSRSPRRRTPRRHKSHDGDSTPRSLMEDNSSLSLAYFPSKAPQKELQGDKSRRTHRTPRRNYSSDSLSLSFSSRSSLLSNNDSSVSGSLMSERTRTPPRRNISLQIERRLPIQRNISFRATDGSMDASLQGFVTGSRIRRYSRG